MKNKKSLLSLGLLTLVLVLGVGYAIVSSVDLTIGGTATVKDAELAVDIENVADSSTGSATIEHTWITDSHAKDDTFTITDMVLNEEVTITYTVKNHETDVDATLAEKVALTNSNEEYFSASYSITETALEAEAETTIVVKVKLIKTPVDASDNSATIGFTVSATADDNSTSAN